MTMTRKQSPSKKMIYKHEETPPISPAALTCLLTSWQLAGGSRSDPWQFAVRIGELRLHGVQESELRWLVARDYAHHAHETTQADAAQRTFRRASVAHVDESSAFILNETGAKFALQQIQPRAARITASPKSRGKPKWDGVHRELRVGTVVVKRYRVPARDQQLLLAAFEEEGWPEHIDDPLPHDNTHPPNHKLRVTVNSLNRNQRPHLIQFSGDGTGEGVLWCHKRES